MENRYWQISFVFCFAILIFAVQPTSVVAALNKDNPPFSLTLQQVKAWKPHSVLADVQNISAVPLQERFPAILSATHKAQDLRVKVLIAPDGMNNFGNYLQAQDKFNLYNFTHWAHIDVLNWFAGTATQTVNIPARPWVEAAHKNGVKVIGSVFLAVTQWGGDRQTVADFLQQDEKGRFLVAHQLVDIANYYGFDGWLMNQETDLTLVKDKQGHILEGERETELAAELGEKMWQFMAYLTKIAPAGMEIHWYDAMLLDGSVQWQNQLNHKNVDFLQTEQQRTSDAIFLNYWWDESMVLSSREKALAVNRSPYDVYVGADLWPMRNAQKIFTNSDWLHWLFDERGNGRASIALFANNANYNFSGEKDVPAISHFQQDSLDVDAYYKGEVRLFAGDDLNLMNTDNDTQWPGIGAYVPAKSSISQLPFITHFNTGHGLHHFSQGKKAKGEWHDMAQQDWLPTWQFAVQGDNKLKVDYDFSQAWYGGSSLRFVATELEQQTQVPLFQTHLTLESDSKLQLVAKSKTPVPFQVLLSFEDEQQLVVPVSTQGDHWQQVTVELGDWHGKVLRRISIRFNSSKTAVAVNLGSISVQGRAD